MTRAAQVTNLFLSEPPVQALLERGEVQTLATEGALYLLRDQGDFRRLYFAAESIGRLASLNLPPGEFITDVVGRAANIGPVSDALGHLGFRFYKEFQRMARGAEPPATPEAAGPVPANPSD